MFSGVIMKNLTWMMNFMWQEKKLRSMLKKNVCLDDDVSDGVNSLIDSVKTKGQTSKTNLDKEKVVEYESD